MPWVLTSGIPLKPVFFFSENQVGWVDPTLYTSDEAVLLIPIRVLYVPSVTGWGFGGFEPQGVLQNLPGIQKYMYLNTPRNKQNLWSSPIVVARCETS